MALSRSILAVIALLIAFAAKADRSEPAPERPSDRTRPYIEHAPSTESVIRATEAYTAGQFDSAMEHYLAAARWADKFAQYNVGIMHLRGEGVEFDPLRGWAWLEVSAERGYPQFSESADALWALFNEEERQAARAIFDGEVEPRYGDGATLQRAEREMRFRKGDGTGSRLGSRGMMQMLRVYEGFASQRDGMEFYDPEKWDFATLARYEALLMQAIAEGQVDIGELELDAEPE